MSLHDEYFHIKLKTKDIQSPWIRTEIKESSKHKKRQKNPKNYKNLLEQIKKREKRIYLPYLIMKYKNNLI